ncbi:MAG: hypothetical protein PHT26_09230 [Lentimicrobiaceae bacterium]|nr:hypothetical protein [Lentimicrobiaceae bacterium]
MATRILLVSMLLSLLVACDKKEDDIKPGHDYTGTLTLDYTRTFPAFTSTLSLPVEITASCQVFISKSLPHAFEGESDKFIQGERIKIREKGVINISEITPMWTQRDANQFLEVSILFAIEGEQTVWKWADYYWEQTDQGPYLVLNPTECPMVFRINNALMSEAVCVFHCEDCWGMNNFRWRLQLHEAP